MVEVGNEEFGIDNFPCKVDDKWYAPPRPCPTLETPMDEGMTRDHALDLIQRAQMTHDAVIIDKR